MIRGIYNRVRLPNISLLTRTLLLYRRSEMCFILIYARYFWLHALTPRSSIGRCV